MRTIFADTHYLIAISHQQDQWHGTAKEISKDLQPFHLVTTETVLLEMLNFFAEYSPFVRQSAAHFAWHILAESEADVVLHTHDSFLAGLDLYSKRLDKGYSLTDCISMNVMRERGISEILTHDHHFAQEGFTILL